MMWPWGYGFMGGWMVLWGLAMLAFWAGVILLVVWGARRIAGCGSASHEHSALDTARERYARGELTREQFEQFKRDLS